MPISGSKKNGSKVKRTQKSASRSITVTSPVKKGRQTKISTGKSVTRAPFHLFCVGASAGGIHAVNEIVSQLVPGLNAAYVIVLHLSKAAVGEIFVDRIKKHCRIPVLITEHNQPLRPDHVYIARANAHTLVKHDRIILGHGPPENRFRPSIDVLFRSAAVHFASMTTGIVLTGFLNDGTIGMQTIKSCGGTTIVQDPNEAEFPDMPLSVMETMEVDHCVGLKEMGSLIQEIASETRVNGIELPPQVVAESKLSETAATGIETLEPLGERTVYGCPDCGGSLFEIKEGQTKHYRCHVGHSYSGKDLNVKLAENAENAIWVALRMMEERRILNTRSARDYERKGLAKLAAQYKQNAEQLDQHISKLKELLFVFNTN